MKIKIFLLSIITFSLSLRASEDDESTWNLNSNIKKYKTVLLIHKHLKNDKMVAHLKTIELRNWRFCSEDALIESQYEALKKREPGLFAHYDQLNSANVHKLDFTPCRKLDDDTKNVDTDAKSGAISAVAALKKINVSSPRNIALAEDCIQAEDDEKSGRSLVIPRGHKNESADAQHEKPIEHESPKHDLKSDENVSSDDKLVEESNEPKEIFKVFQREYPKNVILTLKSRNNQKDQKSKREFKNRKMKPESSETSLFSPLSYRDIKNQKREQARIEQIISGSYYNQRRPPLKSKSAAEAEAQKNDENAKKAVLSVAAASNRVKKLATKPAPAKHQKKEKKYKKEAARYTNRFAVLDENDEK